MLSLPERNKSTSTFSTLTYELPEKLKGQKSKTYPNKAINTEWWRGTNF